MQIPDRQILAHQRFAANFQRVSTTKPSSKAKWFVAVFVVVVLCLGTGLLYYITASDPGETVSPAVIHDQPIQVSSVEERTEPIEDVLPLLQDRKEGDDQPFEYWKPFLKQRFERTPFAPKAAIEHDRYVTFEDDTGGWNNIRMAFEVFVVVAKSSGRILVLPPRCRFYLLDRGPISAFDKSKQGETSSYDDYYNFDVLRQHVQIITTEEFLQREKAKIGIPENLVEQASKPQMVSNGAHTDYFLWLRESPDAIMWPSGPRTSTDFNLELSSQIHTEKKIIHFPMHVSKNLRYLGGVPPLFRSMSRKSVITVKRFVRASLVYGPHIYRTAQEYIRLLGGYNGYTALHIRRNELQYKSVFVSGESSASNVLPLVNPGEVVYLATDETSPGFFDAFHAKGITVLRMSDLREKVEKSIGPIHPKFEGMVEQVICAGARVFAGTPYSSYTAHIQRLRRYMHASSTVRAEKACLFHTKNYADAAVYKKDINTCASNFADEIDMGSISSRL